MLHICSSVTFAKPNLLCWCRHMLRTYSNTCISWRNHSKVYKSLLLNFVWARSKRKVYFKCCKAHFSGQVYFINHKECFNCSIKYILRNVYFIEQLKHSLWSIKYCWPHVLYSRLIARTAQPAQLITQPEQADSPRCTGWLINPASSQQKANCWIAFIDLHNCFDDG